MGFDRKENSGRRAAGERQERGGARGNRQETRNAGRPAARGDGRQVQSVEARGPSAVRGRRDGSGDGRPAARGAQWGGARTGARPGKGFDAARDPRIDDQMVVYGIHPVQEFLAARPKQIRYILLDKRTPPGAIEAARQAATLGIAVREASAEEFSDLVGFGNAQGIVAVLKPLESVDGDDLIEQVAQAGDGLLIALDSVQDPQNLGSILRTAAFFGAAGVIITKDRSVRLTSSAVRASAGGAARVPVGEVTNLARTLQKCVDLGMTVVGTVVSRGKPVSMVPKSGPRVIVLGSEGAGMRRLVMESCSMLVTIPSPGGFESLNVGVTAGIMLCAASPVEASPAPAGGAAEPEDDEWGAEEL